MLRINMKYLALFVFLATGAYAADDKFADHKQHMLKELDEQIATLQSAKSCVNSASDHESMKRCHEEMEKARKKHREEEIDEQMHHLQEEKERLNKKK